MEGDLEGAPQSEAAAGIGLRETEAWLLIVVMPQADGLGSTMKTVDSSGVVVNQYEYDVYGTLRSSSGSQHNDFQFAGQQTDPTGLQYLRARYYDMETGTFLSRDPLAASQAWTESPFAYASGNATNLLDPLGLCSKWKPWQCGDEALGAAKNIGGAAVGAVEDGGRWLAEDYRWADAAAIAGAVTVAAGISLASGGTATPLVIGLLTTGGLTLTGVGVIGVAADLRDCKQGDRTACLTGGLGVATTTVNPFLSILDPWVEIGVELATAVVDWTLSSISPNSASLREKPVY